MCEPFCFFLILESLCMFSKRCAIYVSERPAKYFSALRQRWKVETKHRPPLCSLSFVGFSKNHFQFVSLLSMPGLSQENPFMMYVVAMVIKPTIGEADQIINSSQNQQPCPTAATAAWLCWRLSFSLRWWRDGVFLSMIEFAIYLWKIWLKSPARCLLASRCCHGCECASCLTQEMSPAETMIHLINSFLHLRICRRSSSRWRRDSGKVPRQLGRCWECCLSL